MKKKSKIALAATATLTAGALAFALPSLADHGSKQGSSRGYGMEQGQAEHQAPNLASISATITDIPADLTDVRQAAMGATYEVFKLADDATEVPAVKPTDRSRTVAIRPAMVDGEPVIPEIIDGQISAELTFPAPREAGVVKLGLYPSNGSDPILVTVTTDDAGQTSVVSSAELSLSYDAEVSATNQERMAERGQEGRGPGGKGKRMGHGPDHDHEDFDNVQDEA